MKFKKFAGKSILWTLTVDRAAASAAAPFKIL